MMIYNGSVSNDNNIDNSDNYNGDNSRLTCVLFARLAGLLLNWRLESRLSAPIHLLSTLIVMGGWRRVERLSGRL